MRFIDTYRSKLMPASEAVKLVKSGDHVWIHAGCAEPETLVRALVGRAAELRNVEMIHMMTVGRADYIEPQYHESFRHSALFIGSNVRAAVDAGYADYTPIFLSEIEDLFLSGQKTIDVAFIQCSPPDQHGYLSLGVSVDCTLTAARCARLIVAEVNDQMPRTHGDSNIHITRISAIVESSHPVLEHPPIPYTDLQHRIAQNVASLIPDGATLQLGIGGIPDAVLSCLEDHKDLGIHSEMVSDGIIPLIEKDVITGDQKTLLRGKIVCGFVLGTNQLFRFIDENPFFEFRTIQFVNDPFVVARNDKMCAINSALQVDLTGQVCSDSIGTRPYSGFGGQVDFIRGAARSKGGRPIIALPSTAKHGTVSRIATVLDPGAGVVTSRADVHYVVTEYGVANLHGKTLRQRAEALIAIAHPKFRDDLYDFAVRTHYLEPRSSEEAADWRGDLCPL